MSGDRPVWHHMFEEFLRDAKIAAQIEEIARGAVMHAAELGRFLDPDKALITAALCVAWGIAWEQGRKALLEEMGLAGIDDN